MRLMTAMAAGLLLAGTAAAQHEAGGGHPATSALAPEAGPAAAVVDAFHAALQKGDATAALSYLAGDALIYEAGGVERGKQEYAAHHLGADSAFAQAVPGTATRRAGEAAGDVAWIASEGRTTGTYKGKAVDRITTETMVLQRQGNEWKIVHIHWSSRAGGQ